MHGEKNIKKGEAFKVLMVTHKCDEHYQVREPLWPLTMG